MTHTEVSKTATPEARALRFFSPSKTKFCPTLIFFLPLRMRAATVCLKINSRKTSISVTSEALEHHQ